MGIPEAVHQMVTAAVERVVAVMSQDRARRLVAPYVRRRYTRDRRLAMLAPRMLNPSLDAKEAERLSPVAGRMFDLGYLKWPEKLNADVAGLDVLDVGCGTGAHGVGFLLAGAKSYTGIDPHMDERGRRLRNNHTGEWVQLDWSAREIMSWTSRIRLSCADVAELPPEDCFDVAILHNVTEHVPDLGSVLSSASRHLRPGGCLIFNHHNFFCWNGHHRAPKTVDQVDAAKPEDRAFADWGHVDFEPPPGHMFLRKLNRLRIAEVRAITARHFDILDWQLIPSTPDQGAERLSDEIRARHPDLTDEDFLTQHILCRATPKTPAVACSRRAVAGEPAPRLMAS